MTKSRLALGGRTRILVAFYRNLFSFFFWFRLTYRVTRRFLQMLRVFFFFPFLCYAFSLCSKRTANVVNVHTLTRAIECKQIFQCVQKRHAHTNAQLTFCVQRIDEFCNFEFSLIRSPIIRGSKKYFLFPNITFSQERKPKKVLRYSFIEMKLCLRSPPLHLNCVFCMCGAWSQLHVVFHKNRTEKKW